MMDESEIYKFSAKVWLYKGDSPWHFVTINKSIATTIKANHELQKRGFGSIPVKATVGKTSWKTSIFPDKDGVYLLPIKKQVRQVENIQADSKINFELEIAR